jgi:predicted Zn-dependent protease
MYKYHRQKEETPYIIGIVFQLRGRSLYLSEEGSLGEVVGKAFRKSFGHVIGIFGLVSVGAIVWCFPFFDSSFLG